MIALFISLNLTYGEDLEHVFLNNNETNQYTQTNKNPNSIKYGNLSGEVQKNEYLQNLNRGNLYQSQTFSHSKEKNYGNFTVGAKTDTKLEAEKFSQGSSYYTKYQKDKFGVKASYNNSGLLNTKQDKGSVSLAPEYKFNNKIKLQNVYSAGLTDRTKKGELNLNITPFKDDRMDFNVGAGQVFTDDSSPSSSRFNFSTKFKF